jgi:lactose/L-arabinose transport system substrate-binding protein
MKKFRFIAISLMLFAACAAVFASGKQDAAAAKSDKPVELTVWTWTYKCLNDWLVPAFEKKNPGIKIETISMSHPDTHDKAFVAIATGSGAPDFLTIDSAYIQKFIDQGGLVDMTDYVKPIAKNFPDYKIANDSDASGRIFGVPFDCGPVGMYYRKDIFDKYNVKLPETWDEYIEAGKQLKKNGVYITSVSIAAAAMDASMHGEVGLHGLLTQQQAGAYFDKALKPTLNTPESVRAMKLIKQMVDEGIAANVAQGSPAQYEMFDKGQIATIISAAWYVNTLYNYVQKDSPAFGNWRVAKLPAFEKGGIRASNLGGSEVAIPKQTSAAKKEAAMKFIDYACSSLEGAKVHADYGEFPAFLPSYSSDIVQQKTFDMFSDQKIYKLFAEITPTVPTAWRIPPKYTEVQSILQAKMNAILTNAVSVEAGLEQAQAEALLRK